MSYGTNAIRPRFFGKLPTRGDVIGPGLPPGLVYACRCAIERDWVLASLSVIAAAADVPAQLGMWWTEGGAHVAGSFEAMALPGGERFQQMLRS